MTDELRTLITRGLCSFSPRWLDLMAHQTCAASPSPAVNCWGERESFGCPNKYELAAVLTLRSYCRLELSEIPSFFGPVESKPELTGLTEAFKRRIPQSAGARGEIHRHLGTVGLTGTAIRGFADCLAAWEDRLCPSFCST